MRLNSRLATVKESMNWKIMRNSPIMQLREMKNIEGQVCMEDRRGSTIHLIGVSEDESIRMVRKQYSKRYGLKLFQN